MVTAASVFLPFTLCGYWDCSGDLLQPNIKIHSLTRNLGNYLIKVTQSMSLAKSIFLNWLQANLTQIKPSPLEPETVSRNPAPSLSVARSCEVDSSLASLSLPGVCVHGGGGGVAWCGGGASATIATPLLPMPGAGLLSDQAVSGAHWSVYPLAPDGVGKGKEKG